MTSEQEQRRENFIVYFQRWMEDDIGIRPSFKQIDRYVGATPRDLNPGRPPWMKTKQTFEEVKLN
jgi:hypothetical protein